MLNQLLMVNFFGHELDFNGTLTLVLLIAGIALLLGAIITLLIILILTIKRKNTDKKEDETDEPMTEEEQSEESAEVAAAVANLPEEESYPAGILSYDRSFTAKYIQSSDEVKQWYIHIKNELLSYKKVNARMSWKRESFRRGRETVARLSIRGKTLCLYLALDPKKYADSKYAIEDVSEIGLYADTPCLYRIRSDRRENYSEELIADVMKSKNIPKTERPSVDYYVPYEGMVELIDKGLIKRVVRDSNTFPSVQPDTNTTTN